MYETNAFYFIINQRIGKNQWKKVSNPWETIKWR